jgi:hypothetical protein
VLEFPTSSSRHKRLRRDGPDLKEQSFVLIDCDFQIMIALQADIAAMQGLKTGRF